jgi:F420-non-reducing hydrogenase iron-sulfur subunit
MGARLCLAEAGLHLGKRSLEPVKRKESKSMEDQYEPLIVAFCCNWCSYAGADLAGVSRIQYPPNGRIIRVMCSGMVHPNLVINALTKGADGVLVCG